MADTTISTANRVKQWDDKAHREYIRANRFRKYMGTDENAIIQLKENLTKKKGDAITIPLVGALDAAGGYNDGSTTLVGAEKALPNDGFQITVGVVRDAVTTSIEEEQASPIDIRNAAKVALKDLQMRYLRNDLITALGSITGVPYGTASASQKNAWDTLNSDRVLFGDAIANFSAGGANTHALRLANITSGMTLDRATVSLLKRIAQNASNVNGDGIRPFRYGEDEETFVLFVGSKAYRDLKLDMATVLSDAEKRGKDNPLFTGTTSLYWDGVVIREIPEIADVGTVGDASANVAPVYLCGAQSLGVAWAKRTTTTTRKEDDYGLMYGVGFMEMRGVEKILYGSTGKQWGVVTGFVAAAADA
jgi:hypothetical protein